MNYHGAMIYMRRSIKSYVITIGIVPNLYGGVDWVRKNKYIYVQVEYYKNPPTHPGVERVRVRINSF